MMELSGNVKQFAFANQIFPGGALFLLLTDGEFKKLMIQLSSEMLEEEQGRKKIAARLVGENTLDGKSYWVLSESIQIAGDGSLLDQGQWLFLWLRRFVNGNNILIEETLVCKVCTPLDGGESIFPQCQSIHCGTLRATCSQSVFYNIRSYFILLQCFR